METDQTDMSYPEPMSSDIDGSPDPGWMDHLEGGTFLSFKEPVIAQFLSNNPIKRKNSYGKDVWEWNCLLLDDEMHEIGPRILSTASKRLKRVLKANSPLIMQTLRISRSGSGMETEYAAQKLAATGNNELV